MTRREMRQRIRELEKRVARLELGPTNEDWHRAFPLAAVGYPAQFSITSDPPPKPKPGENGGGDRLTT